MELKDIHITEFLFRESVASTAEYGQRGRPETNGERRMKTEKARLDATGGGERRRMNSRC